MTHHNNPEDFSTPQDMPFEGQMASSHANLLRYVQGLLANSHEVLDVPSEPESTTETTPIDSISLLPPNILELQDKIRLDESGVPLRAKDVRKALGEDTRPPQSV